MTSQTVTYREIIIFNSTDFQTMNTFVQILGCDGTALYENDGHSLSFSTSGRLEVLIAYDGMVSLKLNHFEYTLKSSDEIICDKNDPQFQMVLYLRKYPTGKWILKINQHSDEVYSCLNEKCYIKDKSEEPKQYGSENAYAKLIEDEQETKNYAKRKVEKKKKQQKQEQKHQKHQDIDIQDEQHKEKHKLTAKNVLVGASKGLGLGLKLTGRVLSKGFQALGTMTAKAVKPAAQKVQVSQNAKANIELAKNTTKTVFGFAAAQVGNLFKFGKEAASNIGQRLQKTQKGKELQQNSKYQTIKQGTKTGVQVVSNIYQGVVSVVYEVGSGISKGTSKVVGKKYGDEAGQAVDDMFEGLGNVIKISRIPQDQAAKALK